jgi:hypothetical protein
MRFKGAWSSVVVVYAVVGVGTGACGSDKSSTEGGTGAGETSSAGGASGNGVATSSGSSGTNATSSGAGGAPGQGSSASSSGAATSGAASSSSSSAASSSSSSSTSSSGSTSATCTWGNSTATQGTFTEYYFSQGTAKTNNYYETACGYYGTETTTNGYGSVDPVLNVANDSPAKNTYFAAFPGNGTSWTVGNCGACIEFTGSNGNKVIATIIDECPTGSNPLCTQAGHLDLSTALFADTMVNSGGANNGGDPGGGSWQFIACPITTDIMIRFNNEYMGQIYIQNTIFPVKTATANGAALTQSPYGYWGGGPNNLAGTTLTLTDVEGHVVSGTVPGSDNTTGASLGVQFPSPGTCPL